jgi:hypothetical protein
MKHLPDQTVRAAGGDASGRAPASDFDDDTILRKPPRHSLIAPRGTSAHGASARRGRAVTLLDQDLAEEKEALREVEKSQPALATSP